MNSRPAPGTECVQNRSVAEFSGYACQYRRGRRTRMLRPSWDASRPCLEKLGFRFAQERHACHLWVVPGWRQDWQPASACAQSQVGWFLSIALVGSPVTPPELVPGITCLQPGLPVPPWKSVLRVLELVKLSPLAFGCCRLSLHREEWRCSERLGRRRQQYEPELCPQHPPAGCSHSPPIPGSEWVAPEG